MPENTTPEEESMNSAMDAEETSRMDAPLRAEDSAETDSTQGSFEEDEIHFILSWLRHTQKGVLCNNCQTHEIKDIVLNEKNCFDNISSVKCNACDKIHEINPWWMFGEYTEAKQDIFWFLLGKYSPCCNEGTPETIVPMKKDNFGIVRSVGCIKCTKRMSLGINTINRNRLTPIEAVKDLKLGDEIMFRRFYGISHHAIYIEKLEPNDGRQHERPSDVSIPVISHTFDEDDARIIATEEPLEFNDVYRVEYDNCYPPQWSAGNARSAEFFARACKEQQSQQNREQVESNYDPFMENCEHFARRCKTGKSESRQVRWCLYNCGANIAMLALRVAFLAIWWISLTAVEAYERAITHHSTNETAVTAVEACERAINHDVSNNRPTIVTPCEKKFSLMEVAVAASISILFLTVKVASSSIHECRKIKRPQSTEKDYSEDQQTKLGRCGKFCTKCCCKCCPKRCYDFRYFCRLMFCLVPIRLWNKCSTCFYGCSCERKKSCDYPILKFCCTQYVVIALRVFISEVIVIGIPIACYATYELYHLQPPDSYVIRATQRFLVSLLIVLILSAIHSCITNILGRVIGRFCRCCCSCYCFRDP